MRLLEFVFALKAAVLFTSIHAYRGRSIYPNNKQTLSFKRLFILQSPLLHLDIDF